MKLFPVMYSSAAQDEINYIALPDVSFHVVEQTGIEHHIPC